MHQYKIEKYAHKIRACDDLNKKQIYLRKLIMYKDMQGGNDKSKYELTFDILNELTKYIETNNEVEYETSITNNQTINIMIKGSTNDCLTFAMKNDNLFDCKNIDVNILSDVDINVHVEGFIFNSILFDIGVSKSKITMKNVVCNHTGFELNGDCEINAENLKTEQLVCYANHENNKQTNSILNGTIYTNTLTLYTNIDISKCKNTRLASKIVVPPVCRYDNYAYNYDNNTINDEYIKNHEVNMNIEMFEIILTYIKLNGDVHAYISTYIFMKGSERNYFKKHINQMKKHGNIVSFDYLRKNNIFIVSKIQNKENELYQNNILKRIFNDSYSEYRNKIKERIIGANIYFIKFAINDDY